MLAPRRQHPHRRLLYGAGHGGNFGRPNCKSCTSVLHSWSTRGTLAHGTWCGTCGGRRSGDDACGGVGGGDGGGLGDGRSGRGGGRWRGSRGHRGHGGGRDHDGGDGHGGGGGEGCAPSRRRRRWGGGGRGLGAAKQTSQFSLIFVLSCIY